MKLDKKVIIQQKIIENQKKQIEFLESENKKLTESLIFEQNIPKEGYEKAKQLIEELEKMKAEYKRLIDSCKSTRQEYYEKIQKLSIETKEQNKKIDSVYKFLKKIAN